MSTSPLSLGMQMVLGYAEDVDPPNVPAPIPLLASSTSREEIREIPSDWSSQGNLSTEIAVVIQPNTDTIWMDTEMNYSSQ